MYANDIKSYIDEAFEKKLYDTRYWHLLLHSDGDISEIENKEFFLSPNGRFSPKEELVATIKALYNEKYFDDNATACLFPARTHWLKEKLRLKNLPKVECKEYNKVLHRLDPVSATLVFPSAHVNSPASMFGHTFLRVNSSYNSKLLSYAINYAADADPKKENGAVFAIKGLFGGYYGKYSLLPYYDKLKEYRDTENRDIWEYDLNLNKEETLRMVEHMWEIKDTKSTYLFFNKNCSYEMLWLIEIARPSVHLRKHFAYQVIPLETVFATEEENLIRSTAYRASQRSKIEAYKGVLNFQEISTAKQLYQDTKKINSFLKDNAITLDKKRHILEVAVELLQYYYQKGDIKKETYLDRFHTLTTTRATLGKTKKITPKQPPNPLKTHQAIRITAGGGTIDGKGALFLGIRPAYHSLEDSGYGFLRGTQIEFLNIEASLTKEKSSFEKATLLSIRSIAQIDEFFTPFSWRLQLGWDKNSLENQSRFNADLGFGSSIGNDLGYLYMFTDIFAYDNDTANFGVGISGGCVIDGYDKFANTLLEYTYRYYDNNTGQNLVDIAQNFRIKQNFSIKLKYLYKGRINLKQSTHEQQFRLTAQYYF